MAENLPRSCSGAITLRTRSPIVRLSAPLSAHITSIGEADSGRHCVVGDFSANLPLPAILVAVANAAEKLAAHDAAPAQPHLDEEDVPPLPQIQLPLLRLRPSHRRRSQSSSPLSMSTPLHPANTPIDVEDSRAIALSPSTWMMRRRCSTSHSRVSAPTALTCSPSYGARPPESSWINPHRTAAADNSTPGASSLCNPTSEPTVERPTGVCTLYVYII
ncbi:hypothetical protein FB451DRAFT_1391048 [Mycena latifolia]|nr:hypothetical protein FB451DRAFT_1391048 [Mycena latifolia]